MLRATNKKYFWDLTYISIFRDPDKENQMPRKWKEVPRTKAERVSEQSDTSQMEIVSEAEPKEHIYKWDAQLRKRFLDLGLEDPGFLSSKRQCELKYHDFLQYDPDSVRPLIELEKEVEKMHKVPAIKTPATTSISIDKLANWLAGPGVKSKSLQTNAEWFVYMENLLPPRTSFSHPRVEIGKAGSGLATQEKRGEYGNFLNIYQQITEILERELDARGQIKSTFLFANFYHHYSVILFSMIIESYTPKSVLEMPPILPDVEMTPVDQTVIPENSRKKDKQKAHVTDDKQQTFRVKIALSSFALPQFNKYWTTDLGDLGGIPVRWFPASWT
ncbi:hypothetical protein RhiirB3_453150 [Rhizophagus irregularis]|nr:hypothetical protein RhiirB3_453150 [Rhizophagus irregularis]